MRNLREVPSSVTSAALSRYPSFTSVFAMASLCRDQGMSTVALRACAPLRMRVSISAMGSVVIGLPTRLREAGDLPLARQVAQAEPAHAEPPEERARPPAERAAVVRADLELRRPRGLHHQRRFRHELPYARNGMPSARSSALPSASLRALVQIVTVKPLILSTLSRLISGKITCSRRPSE